MDIRVNDTGEIIRVPDGSSDAEIDSIIDEYLSDYEELAASQSPEDVPSGNDLPGIPIEEPEKVEGKPRSASEFFFGALEAMGGMASSANAMLAAPIGFADGYVGSLRNAYSDGDGTISDNLMSVWNGPRGMGTEAFNSNVKARQDELVGQSMYQPTSEAGQEYLTEIGEALAPVEAIEPLMPAFAQMIGNPVGMAQAVMSGRAGRADAGVGRNLDGPTRQEQEIQRRLEATRTGGESLPSGERLSVGSAYVGDDIAPLILDDDPAISLNRYVDDEVAKMYRDASPATREQMINMLNVAQSVTPGSGVSKLPRQIVGDTVASRASILNTVRGRYGERIKSVVADSANERVNTAPLQESFDSILSKYSITRSSDGTFNLDGSRIADGDAQKVLKEIYDRVGGRLDTQEATFGQLHVDKQWLQDKASYGGGESGGKGQINQAIKDMAGAVNDTLRNHSADYKNANDAFASTVKPFEAIAKVSGNRKMPNFDDPSATAELARSSRGLMNNTKGGIEMEYALEDIEKLIGDAVGRGMLTPEEIAAIDFNPKTMSFNADITQMAHFSSTVDSLFPQLRPGSLQGIMDQNAQTVADNVADIAANAATGGKYMFMKKAGELMGRGQRNLSEKEAREIVVGNLFDILER